ncbi:MAG: hypothetical protein HZB26_14380 [Candidatus Hydrogenedentes bacterium]|nr:hypothetical protein [Candidatus Hydrogenedentota bacterium]
MPGEVSHEIGRAYVYVLGGCLERAAKGFRQLFDVYTNPEKLAFSGFSGTRYSFDLSGMYDATSEVLIESKGYKDGSGLVDAYREFLAKAYSTFVQVERHRNDLFWFVTNVSFGSSIGRRLSSRGFMSETLRDQKLAKVASIIGDHEVDEGHVRSLSDRVAIAIFTDSFIKVMGIQYCFRPGDNLYNVMKLIHGGRIPLTFYDPIKTQVRQMNNEIKDVNLIRSGKRLHLPWYGFAESEDDCVVPDSDKYDPA